LDFFVATPAVVVDVMDDEIPIAAAVAVTP
jgi:hypothetical protein